jgi:hypothetical protein
MSAYVVDGDVISIHPRSAGLLQIRLFRLRSSVSFVRGAPSQARC